MDVRQAEGFPGLKDSLIGPDGIPKEARNKKQITLNGRSLMTCSSTTKALEMAFGWTPPMNRKVQKLRWRFSR